MKAIFAVLFILLALILPITAGARIFFTKKTGRLYFSLCLFEKIRILSGYATFGTHKVEVQLKKKKLSFPYKQMMEGRKKFDIFSGFDITEISALLEIGSAENRVTPLIAASVYNVVASSALGVMKTKNPMMRSFNGVEIYEDESVLNYNFNITIIFNLLLLIIAIAKKITESIINGKRAKQNRQSHSKRNKKS